MILTYDSGLWFRPMILTYDLRPMIFLIRTLCCQYGTWPRRRGEGTEAPRKADEDLIKNQVKIFQIYGEVLEWTENVTFQMATCPAGRKEPRTWQERSRWIIRRSWKQKRFPAILIVPSVLNEYFNSFLCLAFIGAKSLNASCVRHRIKMT